jgi:hypothetical protein
MVEQEVEKQQRVEKEKQLRGKKEKQLKGIKENQVPRTEKKQKMSLPTVARRPNESSGGDRRAREIGLDDEEAGD